MQYFYRALQILSERVHFLRDDLKFFRKQAKLNIHKKKNVESNFQGLITENK
jgi:hypothetical protein